MIWASQWFTHPSEKKKKKKKLLPAFTYLTLNPAKSLWNTIPFSSIIPFDSLFHSSLRLTWYIYNDHTFFPPSTSKLIRSSMTLTFATISPFSLNLPSHSTPLWLPISACVSDDPWMRCKSPIETRVTEKKKNTLQPWLFIITTKSNGTWSARRNGPLTLQIEKGGNENRRERVRERLANWIRGL